MHACHGVYLKKHWCHYLRMFASAAGVANNVPIALAEVPDKKEARDTI